MIKQIFKCSCVALVLMALACSPSDKTNVVDRSAEVAEMKATVLQNESDSLAYIYGISIAEQLKRMDSVVNAAVVARAILDYMDGESVMSEQQARDNYLRYLLYVEPERRRGIEEKMLADLVEVDRSYTRTKSGLTYRIDVIGDESLMPRSPNDWLTLRYSIERLDGEQIYPSKEEASEEYEGDKMAFSDLNLGLAEAVKMIGKGGKLEALLPSKLAFGEEGDETLKVAPFETLRYKVEVNDVERNAASKYKDK